MFSKIFAIKSPLQKIQKKKKKKSSNFSGKECPVSSACMIIVHLNNPKFDLRVMLPCKAYCGGLSHAVEIGGCNICREKVILREGKYDMEYKGKLYHGP